MAAALVVLGLMATMVAARATPPVPAPMAGLYNILVAPFDDFPALEQTLVRDLDSWAATDSAIETRGPDGIAPVAVPQRDREAALNGLAAAHQADVVLTGRRTTAGDRGTVVIELLLTARVFGETPEFVGRHEFRLSEPADVLRGNVELSRRLADETLRYVKAVVSFVRGLGHYALDDYSGAELEFRMAGHHLTATGAGRAEVIQLMLGNTLGRESRYTEAAAAFRRALREQPGYARATVGLAEALRAGAGCDQRRADTRALREALGLYWTALAGGDNPLLEMKARLGLGLTHQCLSIAGATDDWAEADAEFGTVLRVHDAAELTGEAGRQSLRLAAEARAGQALTAYVTARGAPDRLAAAAQGYEDAVDLLGRMGVARPTIEKRRLIFLRNLRDVYVALNAPDRARTAEQRIRKAGG